MDISQKTVCVIGAGLSGLASLKCMIDAGFKVTCLEKADRVGGRWNPDCDNAIPRNTITDLPHFLSGYSDFPVPDEFPLYLPADRYMRYFELYAEKFDLLRHIKLGCKVVEAVPLRRYDKDPTAGNHYWKVKYEIKDSSLVEMDFDYLVVSSGFYQVPFIPDYIDKALSNFKGRVIHCIDYKSWDEFKEKKVVVCGLGNSGGDIVAELSRHTNVTYVSTTRGAYVIGRICNGGSIPIDGSSIRVGQYVPQFMMKYLTSHVIKKMANAVYNLTELRLTPKTPSSVIVNDELCSRISSGKVVVKPGIERTFERTVYFTDGSSLDDVDAIILCTGYKRVFPFLSDNLLHMENNGKYLPLYKGIFSPNFNNNTAFVGMFSVFGSVALTAEMQARYAAEVFLGNVALPDTRTMEMTIKEMENRLRTYFGSEVKEYNLIMNSWTYYDELATEIGCRPSLFYLWLTDPVLAWHLCTKYSAIEYRLVGPNKWDGARDEIIRKSERMYAFMSDSRKVI